MTAAPPLSLVVPVLDEERRLPQALGAIERFVAAGPAGACELVVVDNGSQDGSAAIIDAFAATRPWARRLHEPERGKGRAVRSGMLAARGAVRLFSDVDLSVSIDQAPRLIAELATCDVAIASREAPGARRIGEPWSRHAMGRVFNRWVQLVALPGIEDSQCGFKGFTARAAQAIFAVAREPGWAFDVEALLLARRMGLRTREVAVDWHYGSFSRLNPLQDAARMAWAVARVRRRTALGPFGSALDPS
jgi:dolichyl-phosphate beta-glucosyltransferase